MEFKNIFVYLMFNYRWIFVCLFLLPSTIMYDLYTFLRKVVYSSNKKLSENHIEKTKFVQDQVNLWQKSDQKVPMCTGRPSWKAMTVSDLKYKNTMYNIHIDMDAILDIDSDKKVVKVEPLVTMGQLTARLNSLGWTLPLVIELEDLTVGGLIMGAGIQSSSHAVGFFQHICVSFELVLSDGRLVNCSKTEDPDLFNAIPWSHGTLGFLTAVELKIIPSKRYVKVKYEPFYSLEEGVQLCEVHARDRNKNQFVEGILFNKHEGVIVTGNMVDNGTNINAIGRWYKPWFYKHVQTFLEEGVFEECIPLRDYYHRHTKGLFWELEDIVPFGNHPLFRWLLGWAMPPKIALLKMTQTGVIKELYNKYHVLQDLIVPIQHMKDAILFFNKEVKVYPVWLCPVLIPPGEGLVHSFSDHDDLYVDIGLYGMPHAKDYQYVKTTERLEQFTVGRKGYQMLYGGTYCTEKEFCTMYDHVLYNKVRDRLQCSKAFPNVYGKTNKKVRD